MHIGVEAKGVLAMWIVVHGRAAHSSTPWLGDNAVLKAIDVFRTIETLPFMRESSQMFDRPSINLGRIAGGDALNKVPDRCTMSVDVRYLPGQDPDEILEQVRAIAGIDVERTFIHPPVSVSPTDPYVARPARRGVPRRHHEVLAVGRDGASDAASFIEVGIPAVEFGPSGAGHHGPDEWVSVSAMARYRRALVRLCPRCALARGADDARGRRWRTARLIGPALARWARSDSCEARPVRGARRGARLALRRRRCDRSSPARPERPPPPDCCSSSRS